MAIRDFKKEIYTIPNMLSVLRLVLIPVYIYIYLNATETRHYVLAATILAVSCLTDMIDGKIARKFNMISTVGKILDPIADKATQFSLMACLVVNYPTLWALLSLFIVKESFQLIAGLINLRHHKMLDGALITGKICTTVLFVSLIVLVLFPSINPILSDCMILLCGVFMLIAFVDYVRAYYGKNKKVHDMEN